MYTYRRMRSNQIVCRGKETSKGTLETDFDHQDHGTYVKWDTRIS
jgi:hypothetical protein